MAVVEEYWTGVVQRLQAEVDVFAKLIKHNATQGQENEAALSRVLRSFIPRRLGIGSGMVIDRFDNYARQADVLLFEQSNEPTILAQTTQLLHPVESVRASIEVKTRLSTKDIADCLVKRKSLFDLKPAVKNPDGSTHPLFVMLAYDSIVAPASIAKRFNDASDDERPDLYCILEPGIIGGRRGVIPGSSDDYMTGIALLREKDDSGRRVGAPVVVGDDVVDDSVLEDGHPYPVVPHNQTRCLGEPARALLLFVEALSRMLAEQQNSPLPILSYYLDKNATMLEQL
jgi:hypothetical protein